MEKKQKSKPIIVVTVDQPQERYSNLYCYCHLTPLPIAQWRSVLIVNGTDESRKTNKRDARNWQTLSHKIVLNGQG
jgi:hypothetical protein